GAATGKIVCSPQKAEAMKAANPGEALVLVRKETTPEDLRGMKAALGILTAVGGVSSHAALVSRQMGKVCIVGAGELNIDEKKGTLTVRNKVLKEGDDISVNGFTGEGCAGAGAARHSEVVEVLIKGQLKPDQSDTYARFQQVMDWAEGHRKLGVRTNADLPGQAAEAVAFGAEGIGLCRTEHMFFDHIEPMREMILADTRGARRKAIAKLLPYQRQDFEGLFLAVNGLPVTIRTLY